MERVRRRRPNFDRPQIPPGANPRACDHPGCRESGEFRAPRSRTALDEFYWFCLEHVRAYNAAWDYYRGMSAEEIERARRNDIVGDRPSWPLGVRGHDFRVDPEQIKAAFARLFGEEFAEKRAEAPPPKRFQTEEEKALAVLDMPVTATPEELKARYKELVKRHHPDSHGGDKDMEERLKSINQAYSFLKARAQSEKLNAAD
jgi:DnaJ-domain-containing protein 1